MPKKPNHTTRGSTLEASGEVKAPRTKKIVDRRTSESIKNPQNVEPSSQPEEDIDKVVPNSLSKSDEVEKSLEEDPFVSESVRAEETIGSSSSPTDFQNQVLSSFNRFVYRFENPKNNKCVTTVYDNLDAALGLLKKGELITLASRTGLGKSWFALNLIWNVATQTTLPVLVFDFQVGQAGWVDRLLLNLSKIDSNLYHRGAFCDAARIRFTNAANQTQTCQIIIEENRDITPPEVRERALEVLKEHGALGLIVIDFLETLRWPNTSTQFLDERSRVVSSLKSLAHETQTPILVLSHVPTPFVEGKRQPVQLAEVGGNSLLIAESDVVLILHEHRAVHSSGVLRSSEVAVEVEVAKHRSARPGSVFFAFQPKYGRFSELPQPD